MKKTSFLLLLFFPFLLPAQILINEAATSNTGYFADEDGEYADWIELLNAGTAAINLGGYGITDNKSWNKWLLPDMILDAGERKIIFASGKNRNAFGSAAFSADHWETAVFENDSWNYFIGTTEPDADWKTMAFSGTWSSGMGGFGNGDADDNTVIPTGNITEYYRKTFAVSDKTKLITAILSMDYDDGFIAYLNGVEIARNNIFGSPGYMTLAYADHEAAMYSGGDPEAFPVDTGVLYSALVTGENVLAIEVHNFTASSSDLTGRTWLHFGISTSETLYYDNPVWFNAATGNELHTNFKLSAGETIALYTADGILSDSINTNALALDHVVLRLPDGESWCISDTPTPGSVNSGICYAGYTVMPVFTPAPGFYDDLVNVTISGSGSIHYTTDGSEPDITSDLYSAAINIPGSAVVKAKSFETGKLPSITGSATYLIDEATTLPVVSISANSCDLFDEGAGCTGAYDNAIAWNNFNPQIPVSIEYFNADKEKQFDARVKFEVVGNYSIDFPQKGIQLTIDEDFGSTGEIENAIFSKDKPEIHSFNGFRLRNADDDAYSARMRDVIVNRSALPTHAASAGYQNVTAFINGAYWGHYTAREKLDTYFIRDNYGSDPDSIDLIKTGFGGLSYPYDVEAGTDTAFYELVDFLTENPMNIEANYNAAIQKVDIENWVDYFATEFFFQNGDFLQDYHNNIRFFKSYKPDLQWKFMLWDCAYGQNCSSCNTMSASLANPHNSYYADMFNSLLENETFHDFFINRFADLMNYYYTEEIEQNIVDENAAEIAPEIAAQNDLWGTGSVSAWSNEVNDLKEFFENRVFSQRDEIEDYFDLDGKVLITLAVDPPEAGLIRISTITPQSLPWSGEYFNGVPVTVSAIANPGFTFSHWDDNTFIISPGDNAFTNNITDATTFTANFTGSAITNPVIISEINFNSESSLNSGDWIELHNTAPVAVDISGYLFSTALFYSKFEIPSNTIIPANGYIVLAQNKTLFSEEYPAVINVLGNFLFEIDNGGDSISLKDVQGNILSAFRFNDKFPWISTADKSGRTMERSDADEDPALPASWFAGCIGGSPGTSYIACNEHPVIDEINYHASSDADAGDWIEIYNGSFADFDIGGYVIKDKNDNQFVIPEGTSVGTIAYLVIYEDAVKFDTQFPDVLNKVGPMNFSFSNDDDVIRIYDATGKIFQSVSYSDMAPYPASPDGTGTTLQIIDAAGNLNDAANWMESCFMGTPGSAYLTPCEVSVVSLHDEPDMIIYPNPASDLLHIEIPATLLQNASIIIYTMEGKAVIIRDHITLPHLQIPTASLPGGVYAVVLKNGTEIYMHKFVKE